MFISAGSSTYTRDMAKSGSGSLFVMPRTSTIDGVCFNCVETNGAVTTSQGWKVTPGGEVRDLSLSALNPAADHTTP